MSAAPLQPACPRCRTELADEQLWCLECGAAARTRIVAASRWRLAGATLAVSVALAVAALGVALGNLVSSGASTTTVPSPVTPVNSVPTGAQPAPAPAPGATAPSR